MQRYFHLDKLFATLSFCSVGGPRVEDVFSIWEEEATIFGF